MATLPEDFVREINCFDGLAEALATTKPSVSVRLNPAKPSDAFDGCRQVAWYNRGRYLDSRPRFTLDPALHQGAYYVQDASSMFLAHAVSRLGLQRPVAWLDACAAPGGKSTLALDCLPEGSLVVANEAVPVRAAVLRENIIKWGNPNAIVTRGDAVCFGELGPTFDVIAADVPCSGEGMMRKEPEAVAQWSRGLVAECSARQQRLTEALWQALKPGGYMIYSTCTFNRDENEEIVSRLVSRYGAEPVDLSPDPAWGIIGGVETDIPCYHLLPGRVEGEGQFMAVLRKPSDTSSPSERSGRRHKPTPRQAKADPRAAEWLSDSALASMTHTVDGDRINAFTTQWLPLLERLSDRKMPDIIHHGTPVASVKGRDLVPSHALAMATGIVSDSAFSRVETDVDTALQYLRGEAVSVDAPRGHVMLTYGGLPLGFVKNLGNRANNMYPRDWRIRHM